jgi:hypothetical protein
MRTFGVLYPFWDVVVGRLETRVEVFPKAYHKACGDQICKRN